MSDIGRVYIMSYRDLIKVGITHGSVEERARQINSTGMAEPPKPEYAIVTTKREEIERVAHQELSYCSAGKEWFECNVTDAIAVVTDIAERVGAKIYDTEDFGGWAGAKLHGEALRKFQEDRERLAEERRLADLNAALKAKWDENDRKRQIELDRQAAVREREAAKQGNDGPAFLWVLGIIICIILFISIGR